MSFDELLSTDTDKARALLGDTSDDAATELLTDDHISAVLAIYTPLPAGIAFLADELAARYAQQPGSVSLPGGLSVSWPDRVKTWLALAARLRSSSTLSGFGAFAVAGTRADGYTTESTTDEFARLFP